jgi:hypothetical protein
MAQTMKCTCGHEVQISEADKGELIWCPNCRNPLSAPAAYTSIGNRNYSGSSGGQGPAKSKSGGGRGAGIGAGIGIAVVLTLTRAFSACNSTKTPEYHYTPPPPTFHTDQMKDWHVSPQDRRDTLDDRQREREVQKILEKWRQEQLDREKLPGEAKGSGANGPPP